MTSSQFLQVLKKMKQLQTITLPPLCLTVNMIIFSLNAVSLTGQRSSIKLYLCLHKIFDQMSWGLARFGFLLSVIFVFFFFANVSHALGFVLPNSCFICDSWIPSIWKSFLNLFYFKLIYLGNIWLSFLFFHIFFKYLEIRNYVDHKW